MSFVSFGINALTGAPLSVESDPSTVAATALAEELTERSGAAGHRSVERLSVYQDASERGWGDLDPHSVADAGWGVIFATDEDPAIKEAVKRLVDHRQRSAIFTYQPGETHLDWITRNGGQPGSGNPDWIPYYLCIVGGPERIPFSFQYGLDIEYAVGRLYFDHPPDYDQYISNVIGYEHSENRPTNRLEVVIMGATNPGDEATSLSTEYLLRPLAEKLTRDDIPTALYLGPTAHGALAKVQGEMTKATLMNLLSRGSDSLPALLFTASHGWAYPHPDNRQRLQQGALVCQEWRPGDIDPDPAWLFAARDVPASADLRGLVIFAFACFSAGTPRFSCYKRLWAGPLEAATMPIADVSFVAALPKKLLAHPKGPLGFFGHVEQTWASCFSTMRGNARTSSILAFERAIGRVLKGYPLGHALGDFNDRNGSYSPVISEYLERKLSNQPVDETAFAAKWLERNDARGFILLGDPGVAVRAYELQGV